MGLLVMVLLGPKGNTFPHTTQVLLEAKLTRALRSYQVWWNA